VLCAGRKAAGLGKAVEAAGGRVITPAELRDWQVGTVVEQAARDAGVSLDRAAVAALVDMAGADRASIEAAIRGVAAYKGRGARVTEEDLRGLVQRTRQPMPWDLTDAINGRDLKTALKVAGREMADGGPGTQVALFHRIVRQARLLLQTVDLVEARVPDDEAAERLKVKGFPWKKLREAAGRWRRAELAAFLREAPAMEQLAKRAHGSPEAVVADMLSRLIGAGGGPSARRR
jgi:DNA polymerase III delta subunit